MEQIPRGDAHMAKASSVAPYERGQRTSIEDGPRRTPAIQPNNVGSDVGQSQDRSL
jgi:hypothetical protein